MTAAWMVYAICVGLLLTAGATLIDGALRERGAMRGIWIGALVVAIVWPVMVARRSTVRQPVATMTSRLPTPASAPSVTSISLAPAVALPAVIPSSPNLDLLAQRVLLLTPVLATLALLLELIRLGRARRRWHRGHIDNVPILVSPDFGPAIVGVWRPEIVVPQWSLALPAEERALMMAHESEHLASRDSRWLAAAWLAVMLAPWNLGLWWLLRRFRLATEMDCDQRVLRRGHDVGRYGDLLLEIGRRGAGRSLLAAGFAERRTMLRARIAQMTAAAAMSRRTVAWRILTAGALLLAACVLGPAHSSQREGGHVALAPNVADSVVSGDDKFTVEKAAHDLPATFGIAATLPAAVGGSRGHCPMALVDERDGTELRLEAAVMPFVPTIETNNTTALNPNRVGAVAYYSVRPAGRYGVGNGEWLRVGCPLAPTAINLLGVSVPGSGNPPLRLDAAVQGRYGITLDTLQRLGTRLDITVRGDTATNSRARSRDIAEFAWRQLGGNASRLDTITVQTAFRGAVDPRVRITSVKWLFYPARGDLGS